MPNVSSLLAAWGPAPHPAGSLSTAAYLHHLSAQPLLLKDLFWAHFIFLNALQVGQQTLVRSVPGELNTDKNEVLRLAQGRGCISKQMLTEVRQG